MNDTLDVQASGQNLAGHQLSIDTVCDLLADEQRRLLLQYLHQQTRPCQVQELEDHLMTKYTEVDGSQSDSERQRITLSLHHVHLPNLADATLVTWDSHDGTVSLTERGELVVSELLQCLSTVTRSE
jgi:hypothetical protein